MDIVNWMTRHSLFKSRTRDKRVSELLNISRSFVYGGQHDTTIKFEVCTAKPPTKPKDYHIWEPAKAKYKRNMILNERLVKYY